MKYLAIVALLLSTAAYAEDAPKAPEPTFTIPAGAFIFVLDNADLNTVAAALNELPMKQAQPFLTKLQGQAQNQPAITAAIKAK